MSAISPITTHVLDTAAGRPAAGVPVTLSFLSPEGAWETIASGETDADGRLMHWMGHKRIDETMRYVHLVEAHMRPLPEEIVAAGSSIADPDRRVLAMLSKRGDLLEKRGNMVATASHEIAKSGVVPMS